MTHLTFTAAVLLLGTIPQDAILRDEVECIEVNEFFDDEARPVFAQAIFWSEADHVVDWRLLKRQENGDWQITIRRDYARGGYVATWMDESGFRQVRARCFRDTLTQHDKELRDRECFPQERRRKLASGKQVERRWTE